MLEPSQPPLRFRITTFWELLHRNTRDLQSEKRVNKFCTAAPAVPDRDAAFLDVSSLNLAVLWHRLFSLGKACKPRGYASIKVA
jgi:hypothetical protein